jgi:hypothetical protein
MKVRLLAQWSIIILAASSIGLLTAKLHPDEAQAQSVARSPMVSPPQPYLEYQVYGSAVITDSTMPPVLPNGQADYAEIYTEHNLCSLIASGQVDEVWIWAGNGDGVTKGNMWEWTTSGPDWYGDAPNCGKVVTTMAFNYLREVDVALESFNHRLEGFFGHYFTCDFSTATWPWAGSTTWPYSQCGSLLSNRYGFVARPFAGNDQIGGCGDAHHPPNILSNDEYIYNDTTTVETICPSWSQDGSALPASLNCQAWGCTHWGFHVWWMQNVPGLNNINKDRNGNPHPNWWSYLFGIPSAQFQVYLPLILLQPTGNLWTTEQRPPSLALDPKLGFATAPEKELPLTDKLTGSGKVALHSPTSLASQPAVTTRTVYVLYYPGYGGTPRAEVNMLTTELIGLLKEATVYHGYDYAALHGTFLGQDGQSYAGRDCEVGNAPDNIHIRLDGLRTDVQATTYQVEDPSGGGRWANPCNPTSSWLLHVISESADQADLYFKPFRDAPDGTQYVVTVYYSDGTSESITVIGSSVQTLVGTFLGQDGQSYAGQGCTTGTVPDNIHIHLDGLKSGVQPISYRVDDFAGGGVWATPCDPVSNWLLYITSASPDQADLYFKPFRDAPDGTIYTILIKYDDGTSQTTTVVGTHVTP